MKRDSSGTHLAPSHMPTLARVPRAKNHARLSITRDNLMRKYYTNPETWETLSIKQWAEMLGYSTEEMSLRFSCDEPSQWFVPACDMPPVLVKTAAELRTGDRFRNVGFYGRQEDFRTIALISASICGDIQIKYRLKFAPGYKTVNVAPETSFEVRPNA